MSRLTTCPDCGNQISTRAYICPHCGAPSAKYLRKQAIKKRGQYQALGCFSLIIGLALCFAHPIMGILFILTGIISGLIGMVPVVNYNWRKSPPPPATEGPPPKPPARDINSPEDFIFSHLPKPTQRPPQIRPNPAKQTPFQTPDSAASRNRPPAKTKNRPK